MELLLLTAPQTFSGEFSKGSHFAGFLSFKCFIWMGVTPFDSPKFEGFMAMCRMISCAKNVHKHRSTGCDRTRYPSLYSTYDLLHDTIKLYRFETGIVPCVAL
jgi:hypothetical protein